MGVRTPLPSERNRNLDFSDPNEGGCGAVLLGSKFRGDWGDRDSGISTMWAGQLPGRTVVFFFHYSPRNYNSLASVRLNALYVTSCSAALSARTHGIVGPHRGLLQPRPLHLSPPCCARVTDATRGLRLPAHPCPCAPLTSGKLSPQPSHQPSRHRARYLKSRQARRRFSSAPLLPPLANPPPQPAPPRAGAGAAARAAG